MPSLNADGVSVKGCGIIYPPRSQAGEYSALAMNPYVGCGHKCAYCYVPNIPGQPDRSTFDEGAIIRPNIRDRLLADAKKYQALGVTEQVMISFTSDPYAPRYYNAVQVPKADAPNGYGFMRGDEADEEGQRTTRWCFETMAEHGLAFCALTKGGSRALRDLDIFRPDRDAFASTLTSLDDRFSQKWERGAALPGDRIHALQRFHKRGIFCWVSLEPTIDVESSLSIVDACHEFVDHWKIGRVNYLKITKTTDWADYTHRMMEKMQRLGASHYFKLDLQPYLPAGYHNPLRVTQHH